MQLKKPEGPELLLVEPSRSSGGRCSWNDSWNEADRGPSLASRQQRLGFGRVLITRPKIVFLDEATAAIDEGIEHELHTLLRRLLPTCVLVSVGHRGTLVPLHTDRLEILGDGRWTLSVRR